MSNIIEFAGITRLDVSPDKVLEAAVGRLQDVVVIGYDKDGSEYFAASMADTRTSLWLAQRFQKMLMEAEDE